MVTPRTVPMFPLGSVLFPYAVLPLHVFEPRYREMTRRVLEGDQEFGVVLIERGSEVGGGDTRFDFGTMAHIVSASELPDGRFAMLAVGVSRFRVERWLGDDPFPSAEIVEIVEPPVGPEALELVAPAEAATHEVHELVARLQGVAYEPLPPCSPDPEQAAFELAARAAFGPLDAQRLLEVPGTAERLRAVQTLLADAAELLRAQLGGRGDA
jgi:uncharacterized protein